MLYFILWGSKGINRRVDHGDFHCPTCGATEPYEHIEVRRFFTLYFIPLIPLNVLGEYVECGSCAGTFKLEVLDYDPDEADRSFRAEFETALTRTIIHMMMADGHMDSREVDVVRDIHRRLVGRDILPDEIKSEAVALERSGSTVEDYLASVAPQLNHHGKEVVLKAAGMVASADGIMDEEELSTLVRLGKALDLSGAHFKGILLSIQEAATDSTAGVP